MEVSNKSDKFALCRQTVLNQSRMSRVFFQLALLEDICYFDSLWLFGSCVVFILQEQLEIVLYSMRPTSSCLLYKCVLSWEDLLLLLAHFTYSLSAPQKNKWKNPSKTPSLLFLHYNYKVQYLLSKMASTGYWSWSERLPTPPSTLLLIACFTITPAIKTYMSLEKER